MALHPLYSMLLILLISTAGTMACDTFTCPSDGLHADPCDCQWFYNCWAGTGSHTKCPDGTLYSPTLKVCDWDYNVDCNTPGGTKPVVKTTTNQPGPTQAPITGPTQAPITQPPSPGTGCGKTIVCYYSNWAYWRTGEGKYTVDDIDLDVCTHLMYAFVVLDENTYKIKVHDPWLDLEDEGGLGNFKKFTDLKQKKSGLKTLLALGGWNDSRSTKYSVLVASSSLRKSFIANAITFLQTYGFDGLDLDWEYPAYEEGVPADKANFATFVKELKVAFQPHNLMLTAAVSAGEATSDAGYDIPEISKYLDLINLMTYDMHGSWAPTNADHHAPLYDRDTVSDNLNCNYSVNYWISKGAPPSKLVLGVPVYGRAFTLTGDGHKPPASASGAGTQGSITKEAGFLSYLEICKNINNGWKVMQDSKNQTGPYAYSGKQWVGYDDIAMARSKAKYAMSKGLAGTMIWAIDLADFKNTCGDGTYPLLNAMKTEMDKCVITTPAPTATPTIKPTTPTPIDCKPKSKCTKKNGTCIPNSDSCSGKIVKKGCKDSNNCKCCVPKAPATCKSSTKCTKKGGECQSTSISCDGKLKKKLCKGKTCGCCIP